MGKTKTIKKKKKKKQSISESDSDSDSDAQLEETDATSWGGSDIHAKKAKKIKADSSKWDVDHDKIAKNKAEVEAIRQKKRASKLTSGNALKQRNAKKTDTDKKFKNAHDKSPKKQTAKERVGTDWDKIEKQRAEIRRIKEKRKQQKELGIKAESKIKFGNQHESKSGSSQLKSKQKNASKKTKKELELERKREETKAMQRRRASQNKMGIKPKGKTAFGNLHEQ